MGIHLLSMHLDTAISWGKAVMHLQKKPTNGFIGQQIEEIFLLWIFYNSFHYILIEDMFLKMSKQALYVQPIIKLTDSIAVNVVFKFLTTT